MAPPHKPLPPALAARNALFQEAAQQEQEYLEAKEEAVQQELRAILKQKMAAKAAAAAAASAAAPPAEGAASAAEAASDAVAPVDSTAPAVPAVDEQTALEATLKELDEERLAELHEDVDDIEEDLEETVEVLEGEDAEADEQEDEVEEVEEEDEAETEAVEGEAEKKEGAVEAAAEGEDAAIEAEEEHEVEEEDEEDDSLVTTVEDESLLLEEPDEEDGEEDEEVSVYADDYVDEDEDALDAEEDEVEVEEEEEDDNTHIEPREMMAETLLDMARPPTSDVDDPEMVWASMQEYEARTSPQVDEEGNPVESSDDLSTVPDLHLQGIDADTLDVFDDEVAEEEAEEEDRIIEAAVRRQVTWGMTNQQAAEHLARLAKLEKDEEAAAAPKGTSSGPEAYDIDEEGNFVKAADITVPAEGEGEGALDAEGEDAEENELADIEADLLQEEEEDEKAFLEGEAVAAEKKPDAAEEAEEKEEVEEEDPLRTGRIPDFATLAAEAEKEADKEFAEEVAAEEKEEAEAAAAAGAEGEAVEAAEEEGEVVAPEEWVPPTEPETLAMLARQARLDADEVAVEFARDFAPGGENYSEPKEEDPLGVDEADLTPEEAKQQREEILVARQDKEEMLEALPRLSMTDVEDKALGKRDEEEILTFLTKLKLQDHAEKFHSMQTLLHVKSWELKEMGLTVKQRKTLLRVIDRFKMGRRVKQANDLIRLEGARMEPAHLQAAVYRLMYPHIYSELDWRAANAAKEAEWRARITKYREERKSKHSVLNGLREPDLMELAKMEATMMRETLQMHKMGYRKQSEIMKKAGLDFEGNPLVGENGEAADDDNQHFDEAATEGDEEATTQ